MADTTYPIGMYKDHGPLVELEVRYAHTRKEEEALAEAGFTNDRRNLPANDYPRLMYLANGEYMRVVNKIEEDAAVELGYGRKIIVKKEVAAARPATTAETSAANGRIDQLEDDVQSLKESIAQILEAVTTNTKKK